MEVSAIDRPRGGGGGRCGDYGKLLLIDGRAIERDSGQAQIRKRDTDTCHRTHRYDSRERMDMEVASSAIARARSSRIDARPMFF